MSKISMKTYFLFHSYGKKLFRWTSTIMYYCNKLKT